MSNIFHGIYRLVWRCSHQQTLEGLPVGVFLTGRADRDRLHAKVGQALSLLRERDPRRFAWLREDVSRILVLGDFANRGRWHDALRLCELGDTFVGRPETSAAEVACVLVHEATHARLCRMGFGYQEDERVRIERVCYKAQRAFARRLPEPERERLVAQAEHALAWTQHPAVWSDALLHEANLRAMRQAGVPEWLVRVIARLVSRRLSQGKA